MFKSFATSSASKDEATPSAVCRLHPTRAKAKTKALTFDQLDLIYNERRGHGG